MLLLFKLLSIFLIVFFLIHYFYEPLTHTKCKCREAQFHDQVPFFPLVHHCVSHQLLLSLGENSTRMCPINFILWSVIFRVNWNGMFWMLTVLVFYLYHVLKSSTNGVLVILTIKTFNQRFDFCNSDQPSLLPMQEDRRHAIFILLCKRTF